jgi:hypothetical protein
MAFALRLSRPSLFQKISGGYCPQRMADSLRAPAQRIARSISGNRLIVYGLMCLSCCAISDTYTPGMCKNTEALAPDGGDAGEPHFLGQFQGHGGGGRKRGQDGNAGPNAF